MQELWLVEVAFPFKSLSAGGFEVRTPPDEPSHFCPVFTTQEAAEKWADGKYRITRLLRTNPRIGSSLESLYDELGEKLPESPPAKKRRKR